MVFVRCAVGLLQLPLKKFFNNTKLSRVERSALLLRKIPKFISPRPRHGMQKSKKYHLKLTKKSVMNGYGKNEATIFGNSGG